MLPSFLVQFSDYHGGAVAVYTLYVREEEYRYVQASR